MKKRVKKCKTRHKFVKVEIIRMAGKDRIAAALRNARSKFSTRLTVPFDNGYRKYYDSKYLKEICDKRHFYKTYPIEEGAPSQKINYALRAHTDTLCTIAETKSTFRLGMLTFHLDQNYIEKLEELDLKGSAHDPITAIRKKLTKQLLNKFGLSHYYFVVEKGETGLHVHLVCLFDIPELAIGNLIDVGSTKTISEIKDALISNSMVSKKDRAVNFTDRYSNWVSCKQLGKSESELIAHEIETDSDQTEWKVRSSLELTCGKLITISYKEKVKRIINIGLADYLSKGLPDVDGGGEKLFESSKYNFSISSQLRKDTQSFVDDVLSENKLRKKAKSYKV